MNNSITSNQNREIRTEARVSQLVKFLMKPKYREEIFDEFCPRWGVEETTISGIIQYALRTKKIEYKRGFYKAV